ncbi:nitrilase [Zopfia rhizophila CBS 207.26]|uniref:Nitrilase n=1 Tax=Zopfia rhizophila CBS 207.26 TaxID=1314779 RepID=A0A6A6E377_9PEZI|nr:nitrilase [Zopfia rhizophila CBS 207.26]
MASVIRVAACHVAPAFVSARKTTEKAISLIRQASKCKANLVVFPETYIAAFPIWSALRPPTENHHLFKRMAQESILADGEEVKSLQATARELGVNISIGFSEKAASSIATLFNSNIIIGADGAILVHHRKLMPTFFEKLSWAPGDGFGLRVADTPFGRIGNLICGENTNPLARYTLMSQGEQLHISTWPAAWPTRGNEPLHKLMTQSSVSRGANYDNVTANRTRAAAHCFEAKCFGVMCSGVLDSDAIDTIVAGSDHAEHLTQVLRYAPRGVTMFLDPTGAPLQGFVFNESKQEMEPRDFLQDKEGILYAEMDLGDCIEGKQYHDVTGGYQRLDVFKLTVRSYTTAACDIRPGSSARVAHFGATGHRGTYSVIMLQTLFCLTYFIYLVHPK